MDLTVTTRIDYERCIECGECAAACNERAITLENGRPVATGPECIACGHCMAVCPADAIRVDRIDNDALRYSTFTSDEKWLPHGEFDISSLVRLMASRRSCRHYTDKPVPRDMLEDLVRIGITAPSGTNCQLWTFTIIPDRQSMLALGHHVAGFYKKLNKMAEKSYLRALMKLVGKPELDWYYREYYQDVKEGLEGWDRQGIDRLAHGAVAGIVVGSRLGASTPAEDALLASGQILLAAHAMGLGSCMIGFVVSAMQNDKSLKRAVGIPDDETVHACIALGYPDEGYLRTAYRQKPVVRYYAI
jgi:nitroreductase/NAD-dependent dihydropyrimidine dehydrogenase PreA subunit